MALLVPLTLTAGIVKTKHNLTGSESGPMMEVCIFCHTPAGDPNAAVTPSWVVNGGDGTTSFITFDDLGRLDPNRDGVSGTVSVACLSCHDDAQALGVTADTSSDHPVGVAYRGASVPGVQISDSPTGTNAGGNVTLAQGSETAPARFVDGVNIASADFHPTTSAYIDERIRWWVDTGGEGMQRTDIRLYTRHLGEGITVPFIECASCHDPHSEASTFLRIENANSALCLGCHDI